MKSYFMHDSRSMFIQYLWGLLNDMSFLTILTLVSIQVPGIAKILQAALLNFIYMDILQTDKWLIPLIFPTEKQGTVVDQVDEEPIN